MFEFLKSTPKGRTPAEGAFFKARRLIGLAETKKDAARWPFAAGVLADRSLDTATRAHFLWGYLEHLGAWAWADDGSASPLDRMSGFLGWKGEGPYTYGEEARINAAILHDDVGTYMMRSALRGTPRTREEVVWMVRLGAFEILREVWALDPDVRTHLPARNWLLFACVRGGVDEALRVAALVEREEPGTVRALAGTTALAWLRVALFRRYGLSTSPASGGLSPKLDELEAGLAAHGLPADAADAFGLTRADFDALARMQRPTSRYVVIDISAGPRAAYYPVTYLDAEPAGGWTEADKSCRIVLRRVDPCTFTMGSANLSNGALANPPHRVTLTRPYYMGVFPVTRHQWQLVTGDGPHTFYGDYIFGHGVIDVASRCVPVYLYHADINGFLSCLREKTGLSGFSLPTEAQWECACRAGTTTDFNNGSDDPASLDACGWFEENAFGELHPVGLRRPNAWGFHDFHGNVRECCLDAPCALTAEDAVDPVAGEGGSVVTRGGGFNDEAELCSSARRRCTSTSTGDVCYGDTGFRLCLNPSETMR